MATTKSDVEIYQLHVWIRQVRPMIWRRLLVRNDSSIADLHCKLQIAFGWSDEHLNQFRIHGQAYGVYHDGGINFSNTPRLVNPSDCRAMNAALAEYSRHGLCVIFDTVLSNRDAWRYVLEDVDGLPV